MFFYSENKTFKTGVFLLENDLGLKWVICISFWEEKFVNLYTVQASDAMTRKALSRRPNTSGLVGRSSTGGYLVGPRSISEIEK